MCKCLAKSGRLVAMTQFRNKTTDFDRILCKEGLFLNVGKRSAVIMTVVSSLFMVQPDMLPDRPAGYCFLPGKAGFSLNFFEGQTNYSPDQLMVVEHIGQAAT